MLVEDPLHPDVRILLAALQRDADVLQGSLGVQVVVEAHDEGDRVQEVGARDPGRGGVGLQHRHVQEERVSRAYEERLLLHRVQGAVPVPVLEGHQPIPFGGKVAEGVDAATVAAGHVEGAVSFGGGDGVDVRAFHAFSRDPVPDPARHHGGNHLGSGGEDDLEGVDELVVEEVSHHGEEGHPVHPARLEASRHRHLQRLAAVVHPDVPGPR